MGITCPRCGADNDQEQESCTGCQFPLGEIAALIKDRYRMTRPYIFSTFRAVYLAEDIKDGNKVYSVREFLPQIISSGDRLLVRSQFESLLAVYKELDHKNMARIADYFVEGNYYRIVYEFVNGLDITKYMAQHRILTGAGYPEALVAHWALQMCDLFEYLHYGQAEPVFLVDFKPAGVVFRKEDERMVFIDMGLSKILSFLGPHYLITEDFQAYRKAKGKFDSFEWDLFCLGNFMYYLLTGIDLLKIPDSDFKPIGQACPGISPAFAQVVDKAVGTDCRSGYSDVRELKNDMTSAIKPLPLKAFSFYGDFVGEKIAEPKYSWPMLDGNYARTGGIGFSPKIPLQLQWTCKLRPSPQYFLIACDDFVYAISREGMISGIHRETGKLEWKLAAARSMSVPPVASDGVIYLATPAREVMAIEHGKGEPRWKLTLEASTMASPVLGEDKLFVALYNGTICSINVQEGEILTRYKVEGNIIASPFHYRGHIFAASLNRVMCALNVESEEAVWTYEGDTGFTIAPSQYYGRVFLTGIDGRFKALDVRSGEILWEQKLDGKISQPARVNQDYVYLCISPGKLLCLSPDTGKKEWEYSLDWQGDDFPMVLGTNAIFMVDSTHCLLSVDPFTGAEIQKLKMSHPPVSPLVIAHRQLYMVSSTGHVVAFGRK